SEGCRPAQEDERRSRLEHVHERAHGRTAETRTRENRVALHSCRNQEVRRYQNKWSLRQPELQQTSNRVPPYEQILAQQRTQSRPHNPVMQGASRPLPSRPHRKRREATLRVATPRFSRYNKPQIRSGPARAGIQDGVARFGVAAPSSIRLSDYPKPHTSQ
ncbi:MAG: hypothetical protein UW03_C0028G0033, partial [Candidatus Peregrinibacteria bacterium GW2011_GWA2_43_8]